MNTHPTKKLGKLKQRIDNRTLQFSKYMRTVLPPTPPPVASWVTDVPSWPMDLNDRLGICVPAAMAHMEQQWTFYVAEKLGTGKAVIPTEVQVLKAYEDIGGYRPSDPATDQGCDMLTALNYWRKTGLAGRKILAFVQIDPKSDIEWKTAIWQFGSVFAGFALPVSAQSQTAWTIPDQGPNGDGEPGSWGGHCINLAAYSDKSITCVTWGQTLKLSHNFMRTYCDEAYAVLSTDWLSKKNVAPSSFNLDQLKADLAAL